MRMHHLESGICEPLRIENIVLRQIEDRVGELEASRIYGLRATANAWSEPLPRIVESLPESLHLGWIVGRLLD
jgi:hypothetical protein